MIYEVKIIFKPFKINFKDKNIVFVIVRIVII